MTTTLLNDRIEADALLFHQQYPRVWDLFVRFTFELINRGYKNGGASQVFERIRWETDAGADGDAEYKLNNNHRAIYARWFGDKYPEHAKFFRTRVRRVEALAEAA